ncbi:phosphatase PAP2 family protein [Streptomyces sp. GESEQ-35]|uniref:phosphatase PAP2 family protein n=1 Tax=Streptomyces sp. GESEQ-35 TaxID=2812657 RepID=UPI001B31F185|nr:phosphatase PAP2 family protein [Streptomyces sp. GESEQ-35]
MTGTAVVYVFLLELTNGSAEAAESRPAATPAERADTYRESLVEGWSAFEHGSAQLLSWLQAFGHWPLTALMLLWLARRHQRVYVRTGIALMLSAAAGLVILAALPGLPSGTAAAGTAPGMTQQSEAYRVLDATALSHDFATLPSLHISVILLMTLATLTVARQPRVRVLATVLGLSMSLAVALAADHSLPNAMAGAGAAFLIWFTAGALQGRPGARRDSTEDVPDVPEDIAAPIPLVPRPVAPSRWPEADAVPLRPAG